MAKILIVDDSGLSRRTLRAILQSEGHQVIEATDGMVAIERYFLEKPDLVMLDLLMVGMQGMEVLQTLQQMDPGVRVIVATSDLQTLTQKAVAEAGAVDMIHKPFIAAKVMPVVNGVLKGVQKS